MMIYVYTHSTDTYKYTDTYLQYFTVYNMHMGVCVCVCVPISLRQDVHEEQNMVI